MRLGSAGGMAVALLYGREEKTNTMNIPLYRISRTLRAPAASLLLALLLAHSVPAMAGGGSGYDPALVERIDQVAAGITRVEFTNGITARIFSAEYLGSRIESSAADDLLVLDNGDRIAVISDIDDPRILNPGDGTFYPFGTDDVIQALGEIHCEGMALEIDCYLLPLPRSDFLSSSTRGSDIFLSPQVRELSFAGAAFIVTHETGHAFQNRYLPLGDTAGWNEYRRLRGIENEAVYNNTASHAYRPVEIFAEDFRVLCGGDAAHYDGRVENGELPPPETIAGLAPFFESIAAAAPPPAAIARVDNYPNPFNPDTRIQVSFTDGFASTGRRVSVRIYDVAGRFVRELFAGAISGRDLRLEWNGRDEGDRRVASAAYFCMVRAGEETVTRKLLLIQ